MRKYGALLMLIRILSHGNIEETRKLIQLTDGPTHQVDFLLVKEITTERISLIRTSTRKFGDLLMPIKTPFHGNTEGMKKLTQPMDGLIHQADSLFPKMLTRKKTSQTRTSMKRSGAS